MIEITRQACLLKRVKSQGQVFLPFPRISSAQRTLIPMVRYVIQETLRLFPPIATNSRMANKDTVLPVGGGPDGKSPLFGAKHNVVTYSTFVMHRRKELFGDDADDFRPERWETIRPGWEYLPFNGGPRICPGQKFALTEASYTLARLLHAFSGIENLDSEDWREQLTLSLTLNNGVQCRFIP
ncbi:cytochrome P450 alkane hydroxylase [Penicillium hispanicum]|uniref:cytochrome P450 alkane hydroxylase n=1 Tax=Penicillium hispanicum TaxID=1080232 RepID=UPI0025417992|nr:cytochrome P450 alkane hydroxylase [Penicillium hispanicum]KAJ5595524.1 cytochrome P450 alkane hydroxylase [Penicillium hispanicum]